MNIAIVGFDTEGRATYDYFQAQPGHSITICDLNTAVDVPAGAEKSLGDAYLDNLDRFDLIVRTAGLRPQQILEKNPGVAGKITTHLNEFFKVCPTKNIIGVTGTKGKGTTSSLITALVRAHGKHVCLGGNIGIPPLRFLHELHEDSWVVLELSSFQLIDLKFSPPYATCLMVVPEHLNWHADMEEYVTAKEQLFVHQRSNDTAVFYSENDLSRRIASAGLANQIPYFEEPGAVTVNNKILIAGQEICGVSELQLPGKHNWQNVCAAVTTVWQAGFQDVSVMHDTVTQFHGLEHRLELVRDVDSVTYYDDSFGTTPETAIVAIESFTAPKVVILGGSDKGASYDDLATTVANNNVRKVLLIGDQAERIQKALDAAGFKSYMPGGTTMREIVDTAKIQAKPGDVVLLSTACASFGMFHDYKDRGNQFKKAVKALA
jgi:UDP-N-acetylmuramoylalanine--D-glutamate ligase